MKYETGPKKYSEVQTETGPCSNNVQRLFESHKIASKTKQVDQTHENKAEDPVRQPLKQKPQPKAKEKADPKDPEDANSKKQRLAKGSTSTIVRFLTLL